jgi:hypothetical protein
VMRVPAIVSPRSVRIIFACWFAVQVIPLDP